jgi:hypothetical protein
MRPTVSLIVGIAASVAMAGSAMGLSIPVPNGGFESPATADGTNALGVGSPWTASHGSGVPLPVTENPAGTGVGVVDGEQRIRLRTGSYGAGIVIRQTLPAVYEPNMVYIFAITPFDFDGSLVPQFQIALDELAGRTVRAGDLSDALGREIAVSAATLPGDPFIGNSIEISIGVFGQGYGYGAVSFDRARVWAVPIPEPSTVLLLAGGLAGLALRRRLVA